MTNGQICFSQEYCTDCPLRKECAIREFFYSDKEYNNYKEQTCKMTASVAESLGVPKSFIPFGLNCGLRMMDKRRAKELEIHPTYSPE